MNRRSWLLMSLLAALWGASYLFIKVSLEDGLDPVFIVFARIALGALVLVPLALRAGVLAQMRAARRADPRSWRSSRSCCRFCSSRSASSTSPRR